MARSDIFRLDFMQNYHLNTRKWEHRKDYEYSKPVKNQIVHLFMTNQGNYPLPPSSPVPLILTYKKAQAFSVRHFLDIWESSFEGVKIPLPILNRVNIFVLIYYFLLK